MQPRFPKFDEGESTLPREAPLRGKRKKREWFSSKYGDDLATDREVKLNAVCKFYATMGTCRNGDKCKYSHESMDSKIDEPCKFIYSSLSKCMKGSSCHFSHEYQKYPCPLAFGSISPRCSPGCSFSHDPVIGEKSAMQYVRLYKNYLLSLRSDQLNPRWKFYLEEEDEMSSLNRITRQTRTNLFNHQVGTLSFIPRTLLNS